MKLEINKGIVTISKERLASLPAADCPVPIKLIDRAELIDEAIEVISKSQILGFDTETRPSFKKGQSYNVSLIQIATPELCYLFRINLIGLPEKLVKVLEDPDILKVGVSIHDDFHNLAKIQEINPQSFIDLQVMDKEYKIADNSLSRLYAILFGERISKGQRLTNWEASELTDLQQKYAALDAYACIKIYKHLKDGCFDPMQSPYLTFPEPEDNKTPEE